MIIFNNFWDVVINVLTLIVSGFILIKSTNWFVNSASSLAKKLKVPPVIIGLTVVAIGTSFPELVVSILSAIYNPADASLAVGNIIGTGIVNITLILGLGAVIAPLAVSRQIVKRDFLVLMATCAILAMFILSFNTGLYIVWWEGLILFVLAILYIVWLVLNTVKQNKDFKVEQLKNIDIPVEVEPEVDDQIKPFTYKSIIFLILGIAGITFGANYGVESASFLATKFAVAMGLTETLARGLVGLTIVAVGTSLPEMIMIITSAKKGRTDMAIGNLVGSNILNVLFILGMVSIITPLNIAPYMVVDLCVMIAVNLLAFVLCFNKKIDRTEGIVLIGVYVLYLGYLIVRLFI